MAPPRIYLSPPHMSGLEEQLVADVFASNVIAPLGPHVEAFEREFAQVVGASQAVAVSSGTAALHLALQLVGVGRGDEVLVSTLTFVASVSCVAPAGCNTPPSERTAAASAAAVPAIRIRLIYGWVG